MAKAEGIPPTASTASVGPGIRYIGDYCYFYGGTHTSSTTAAIHIDFVSGSGIIIGRLYVNGAIESGSGSGEITTFDIKFNGLTVCLMKTETSDEDMPITTYQDLLIPPFTTVQIEVDSSATTTRKSTITFTGRVYDA